MYKQEEIKPYGKEGEKGKLVEEMFDNIAPTYDTLNHRLSWDIDKGWRKKAIHQLLPFQPKTILDIATGTGDFAILSAKELRPQRMIGIDISEGMMKIGQKKVEAEGLQHIVSFKRMIVHICHSMIILSMLLRLLSASVIFRTLTKV